MKKLVLALSAVAALTGSAFAADLPARTYSKAPAMVAAAPSWTGCYVGGGGGYDMWNQENQLYVNGPPLIPFPGSPSVTNGGRGYFGTVQGGCDYQLPMASWNLVVGAFADYDFASAKGNVAIPFPFSNFAGQEKLSSQWSIGGRAGVLITPSLLTYFVGGYTEATFDGVNFTILGIPTLYTDKNTYKGYFLGAGDEYALNFMPGLFWKTEYRFSDLDSKLNTLYIAGTRISFGELIDSHKYVQSIRSELTYHFNWSGPVVAKY